MHAQLLLGRCARATRADAVEDGEYPQPIDAYQQKLTAQSPVRHTTYRMLQASLRYLGQEDCVVDEQVLWEISTAIAPIVRLICLTMSLSVVKLSFQHFRGYLTRHEWSGMRET